MTLIDSGSFRDCMIVSEKLFSRAYMGMGVGEAARAASRSTRVFLVGWPGGNWIRAMRVARTREEPEREPAFSPHLPSLIVDVTSAATRGRGQERG